MKKIVLILLKRKIKKYNSTFFLKKTLLIIFSSSVSFTQSIDLGVHFIEDKEKPFWISSNNSGIYYNSSIISFKIYEKLKELNYGVQIIYPQNQSEKLFFSQAYLNLFINKFYLNMGIRPLLQKTNSLSSGSLVESLNAQPIPKISFGTINYKDFSFLNFKIQYLVKIAHGWIKSNEYIKNPFLHEKSINIKKEISESSYLKIGLKHMAIWGGETRQFGKQPSSLNDFFRVALAMPGGKNSINQEQKNSLGNHLGAWTLSFNKNYKDRVLNIYMEHPFEDESGARWILNEFDGLYGININQEKLSYISSFTYEHINTMDQSGSKGASDSTYGWDNYYNHYIYQPGWTNKGRVIGNPLFTLGSNKGRYSESQYIINNRFKAHHFGFLGSISDRIYYKLLFTYSENFGIYPDEYYFKSNNKAYRFESGLIQRSGLIELSTKNLYDKIDVSLVYGFDNGELLDKTDSFMLKINHKFAF